MTDVAPVTGAQSAPQEADFPRSEPSPITGYRDEDLVYVDPKERKVVGLVEFNKNGNPKPLAMKDMTVEEPDDDEPAKEEPVTAAVAAPVKGKPGGKDTKGRRPRVKRERFYPWGTYRSMKRIYKLEGKIMREENQKTLDDVMEKALKEPFWD